MVEFLAALFQRACVGLDGASRPGLVNVIDSESLSMGMGLLATLLSEPQVLRARGSPTTPVLPSLTGLLSHGAARCRGLPSHAEAASTSGEAV